jgi:hypothetical protein
MTAHLFTVIVSGESYEIGVYFLPSKSVWIAYGDCKDQQIQVNGSSLGDAVKRWREATTSAKKASRIFMRRR